MKTLYLFVAAAMVAGLSSCYGPRIAETGSQPMRTSGAYSYSYPQHDAELIPYQGLRWDDEEGDYDDNDEDDEGERGYGYRHTRYVRASLRYPDYPPPY